jgi:hypothetical protein
MADFARFAEAVGRSVGWPLGTVLRDYDDNRCESTVTQIEDSLVAGVLLDLGPDYLNGWSGTPTEAYYELKALAGKYAESPRWPQTPAHLTIELRRIAPQLATHGRLVTVSRRHTGRVLTFERAQALAERKAEIHNPLAHDELRN